MSYLGTRLPDLALPRWALRALMAWGVLGALTASTALHAQSVDVSSSGLPGYAYAIQVPPGIAGMTPNLGLSYNGGGVNGPVGYGWSIQGISAITRCPHTRAIDGYTRGVAYDATDKLCLDGQRLIQVDPDSGAVINGSVSSPTQSAPFQQNDSLGLSSGYREYRTEKDTYSRIRAYGSLSSSADGLLYFKVWTKSGQIYEYGNNANSTANAVVLAQGKTVAAVWAASRISDTLGNYIDFQYEQRDTAWGSTNKTTGVAYVGREWNLKEVRYTGTASTAPQNKVVFAYEDRLDNTQLNNVLTIQDRAESYHLGSKNVSIRRLFQVTTVVNYPSSSVIVKVLNLAYTNGPRTQRSLLQSIKECMGANPAKCLPPTTFAYTDGGSDSYTANTNFSAGALQTLTLQNAAGDKGVLTADFNGDGKTDILRWSTTVSENQLYLSNGAGTGSGSFAKQSSFNLTTQKLFSTDGCYRSILVDINGDGITDILRYSSSKKLDGGSCSSYGNTEIYLSNGDGTFTVKAYSGPELDMTSSVTYRACPVKLPELCEDPDNPPHSGWSRGANVYLLDVDGDGRPDLITTILPEYGTTDPVGNACLSQICTHVYKGNGDGTFNTELSTNLAHVSVYSNPAASGGFGAPKYVMDIDGDGLADLYGLPTNVFSNNVAYRSRGDGNFDARSAGGADKTCTFAIDFNGDGRSDCLDWSSSGALRFYTSDTTASEVGNFNISALVLRDGSHDTQIVDINGDGRGDILRYANSASETLLYLSAGDGSFIPSTTFNLNTSTRQLYSNDGTSSFVTGDFTGRGNVEFLRMKDSPSAGESSGNQLYVKSDSTPPDLLSTVTTGTGLVTRLTWVPLSNSVSGSTERYKSDRQTSQAAIYPKVDVVAPIYVVATLQSDTGVGSSTVSKEYRYTGLKAAYDSRGGQGFRETRQQVLTPSGSDMMVTATQYLQDFPYTGVASHTASWLGYLTDSEPSSPLSASTYVYCNMANASAQSSATSSAPCSVPATTRLHQPYLYYSEDVGQDLTGTALPTVKTTNTFNSRGDPLTIVVQTSGTSAGVAQTFTKQTSNEYEAENTSCSGDGTSCYWILGRLKRATQQNTSPSSLSTLTAAAGFATNATATSGATTPAASTPISPAVLTAILQLLLDD
jgi:hypothetical protein